MLGASSSRLQGSSQIFKVNDSVYQLYKPAGRTSIQVVFFHGLQLWPNSRDPHLSTWKCEDDSCIWPQEWLVEDIPEAQIFSVSYSAILRENSNDNIDMFNLGENLISDLLMANIGQESNCPIVLVGHSIGGLVIKELCCQAHERLQVRRDFETKKLEKLVNNMSGVFYYATPHHGSPAADRLADKMGGALLKFFKTLSRDTERLNSRFDTIRKVYEKWQFAGLGEGRPTNLGWFGGEVMVGPEASVRKDNFNVVDGADHFSICRPRAKSSRSFHKLKDFLIHIVDDMKVGVPIHEVPGLPNFPLDLERRALDVKEKLVGGAALGIFGMGGIGKTTLARQAFNILSKDFEYTCFVDNVKGIPSHELQDRVLSHFHHNGKKPGKGSMEWQHLRSKKALIAMDDIDAQDQLKALPKLEHFGAGSCVIMTSRDKEVFKYYKGCIVHEVEFLKHDDAKTLFCHHAFELNHVPDFLIDKVNAVVKKCGGLPLTLEVIGTYLRGRNVEVWIEALQRLRKAQAITGEKRDRVWASLRISYDALLPEEQEMFTEAASCFFERRLDRALAAWSSLTQTMQTTWDNLVSRSLVKEIKNRVWVHEQLRDLAQNISNDIMVLATDDVSSDSAVDRLNDNEVEVRTKSLRLWYRFEPYKSQRTLQLDSLAKLEGLKYIDLCRVSTEGSGNDLTREISLLRFDGGDRLKSSKFEPSLKKMENLAVLELWNFWIPMEFPEALGNLTNLRILCLSKLEGLAHLPENFGHLPRLRRLELRSLRSLTLPKSFGNLRALEHLELENIESLALPESLGNLSCLATLTITNCEELAGLPDSFGSSLTSLEEVHITSCPLIKCLPQSFSRLSGLKKLSIQSCRGFEELGDAFGNLASLRVLYLNGVALERLPPSFSLLSGLESLHISTAGQLRSLPDDFAEWTALKELYISSAHLETLPESFCCLKSLRQLTIVCRKLEMLPESLGELALLEELELDVDRVETLPLSVGNLYALRDLTFKSSVAMLLPESMEELSSLKTFKLQCPKLEEFPDTLGQLSALEVLSIDSSTFDCLPESLGGLQNLRDLSLGRARRLKRLPEDFGQLLELQYLKISNAPLLQTLPDSFSRLKSLQSLILDCSKLERLPDDFGTLSSLQELSIRSRRLESLPESVQQFQSLKKVTLAVGKNARSLLDCIGQIPSLQEVEFDCDGHEEAPDLFEHFRCFEHELTTLTGRDTRILPAGLGSLSSLRALNLQWLRSLETLPDELGALSSLERLTIVQCDRLESLPDSLGQLSSLKQVTLGYCSRLKTLPESLGRSSSVQVALPQGEQGDELRLQVEQSSQTTQTNVMRVFVYKCRLLNDSKMESLGWTYVSSDIFKTACYQRQPPHQPPDEDSRRISTMRGIFRGNGKPFSRNGKCFFHTREKLK